ncbi:MAG: transcription antitermination factor NusB [Rhodospirillales bacterium]
MTKTRTAETAGLAARRAALAVLSAVIDRRQPLDEALAQSAPLAKLSSRDRAFARLLIATLLRRLPEVDRALSGLLQRPLPAKAEQVRWVLRLGAAQLLFLETAPHAAVGTSVDLLSGKLAGFKGLANAVLRRLSREGKALPLAEAARLNTPDWLWRAWSQAYGDDQARAIAEAHLQDPPLDLTRRDPHTAWSEILNVAALGGQELSLGSLRLPSGTGDPQGLAGYKAGAWWVQDQAAALPVRLFPDLQGAKAVDLCAAPGGKTLQLAAAGAQVTALDNSAPRLERMVENLQRTGLSAELVVADAATWQPTERFDAVLLDAPCSATGTLRRHPDIARIRRPADVAALLPLQARLLRAAVALLRPGGSLVYAVCSLQPEEGPVQIERLLAEGAPLRRLPIRADELDGQADLVDREGALRSLPSHLAAQGGLDGFYACRLERLA